MRPPRRKGIVLNREVLGFPHVEFITHALERLKQRGITREQVIQTVDSPDEIGLPTAPSRKRVRKVFGGDAIDVVFELRPDRVRIITAWKDSAAEGKGVKVWRDRHQAADPGSDTARVNHAPEIHNGEDGRNDGFHLWHRH